MTTGHLDFKVVSDRLDIVQDCLQRLRALPTSSLDEFTSDYRNPAAAESLLRRSLEALLDIARHLLAKGFGKAPLEYRQAAQLARDNHLVLDPQTADRFLLLAGYRNRMTHFYAEVTPAELYGIVSSQLGDVEAVAEELRQAAIRLDSGAPDRSSDD
jgi:uncharacterized protein YutE (UPF0331/DUF86 family)